MAEPALLGMPLELLVHIIATYLSTAELGALRLTNKYLEKALFDSFAKEFFTKKQFMLSTVSLGVLVEISKHPALAPFLKHVIIGLEQYHSVSQWQQWDSLSHCEAYRNGWADQYTLMATGRDREMLSEAFRNLPNLDTVGIRDYDAYGRIRDEDRWRSYGTPTIYRETGMPIKCWDPEFATRTYAMLLQALADAKRTIPNVEVILRARGAGLTDFAFHLLPGNTDWDPVLEGLQRLLLTLNFKLHFPITEPVHLRPGNPGQSSRKSLPCFLVPFLQRTPALRHLRLNFQRRDSLQAGQTLECITSVTNLLPNLEHLELGMGETTPDILIKAASHFPRVRHLGLWKVELTHSPLPCWIDSEGRYNPWPRLLKQLSKSPTLQLTSISLGCITHRDQARSYRVAFANGKKCGEGTGKMQDFLPQLAKELEVDWPPKTPSGHNDGDEDEDMDDVDNIDGGGDGEDEENDDG